MQDVKSAILSLWASNNNRNEIEIVFEILFNIDNIIRIKSKEGDWHWVNTIEREVNKLIRENFSKLCLPTRCYYQIENSCF